MKGNASKEQCLDAWEKVMVSNEKAGNSNHLMNYRDLSQSYLQLIREHQLIKACILKLSIVHGDKECIETLRENGYFIDTKDKFAYFTTLTNSLSNSNNLITQIMMKRNELDKLSEADKKNKIEFEDMIAEVSFSLKFQLPTDITLAQYNAYVKSLNKRNTHGRRNKEVGSD